MKNIKVTGIIAFAAFFFILGCSTRQTGKKQEENPEEGTAAMAGPPVIIYKTKADYSQYVPVILSEDKTAIVSYPDIRDVKYKGKLAFPTELSDGFLLDNRGIGKNVAFLDYTYEEYSKLQKTPSKSELMKHILDDDPILEMYHCGTRYEYKNLDDELNMAIKEGKLDQYKRLK